VQEAAFRSTHRAGDALDGDVDFIGHAWASQRVPIMGGSLKCNHRLHDMHAGCGRWGEVGLRDSRAFDEGGITLFRHTGRARRGNTVNTLLVARFLAALTEVTKTGCAWFAIFISGLHA